MPPIIDAAATDPHLWLEEVEGDKALAWVRARNAETLARLGGPDLDRDKAIAHTIYTASTKLPGIVRRGHHVYNFWTDAANPRGLWRRTSLASFRTDTPDWELVLDIDALGKAEGVSWVWQGSACLPPDHTRAILRLSRGGADAVELREFDLTTKRFIDGGFRLPESRVFSVAWRDADSLLVAATHEPALRTTAGYPREVRRWRRGTPFAASDVVFAVGEGDTAAWGVRDHEPGYPRLFFNRWIDFFHNELWLEPDGAARVKLDLPADANATAHRGWLLVRPRSPWAVADHTFATDTLLAIRLDRFLAGDRNFEVLFTPAARRALEGFSAVEDQVLITILDNVKTRVEVATAPTITGSASTGSASAGGAGERWTVAPLAGLPDNTSIGIGGLDEPSATADGTLIANVTGFLTPPSMLVIETGKAPVVLKSEPAMSDTAGFAVTQHEATADDGTMIPYYEIAAHSRVADGTAPTVLYGYGGFEVSMLPAYSATIGRLWLERGGVFVQANIRGGGEFGPDWHKAGMREAKRTSHDDLAAVARDLVRRRVTTPARLAAWGGSNGGLLVGNMLTRYPELFGAIWCQVPLLDMRRFSKMLVGASWVAEYGDPDKAEDWAFLAGHSPYHLVEKGRRYPPVLFTTSTRDDRVHPGHARKMLAVMREVGADAQLYENIEGGHAGAADATQRAFQSALGFAFLRATIAGRT